MNRRTGLNKQKLTYCTKYLFRVNKNVKFEHSNIRLQPESYCVALARLVQHTACVFSALLSEREEGVGRWSFSEH